MDSTMNVTLLARIKRAELLSTVGAGVLGGGLAPLLPQSVASYAIPILLAGLLGHAFGMAQKHQLEQQGAVVRVWWMEALYWFCWLILGALALLLVLKVL